MNTQYNYVQMALIDLRCSSPDARVCLLRVMPSELTIVRSSTQSE